jgi:hypothetical protein
MEIQQILEMLAKMQEKADADRKERKGERIAFREEMRAWWEKIDAETNAIPAERKAMRDKRMEANLNACRKETMACQETTEANPEKTEPNPDMESEVEGREVPTEEAAVKSSGTMKKRHRCRHLAEDDTESQRN